MGLIISRFRRKKTTNEVLEVLETRIKSIEQQGQCTERKHKQVVGKLMAFSMGLYALFALAFYLQRGTGDGASWSRSLCYATPLLVMPILILMIRRLVSWYFTRKLHRDQIKLSAMRAEKKKIIEEVMNTETYKVAKEILDKFGSNETEVKGLKPYVPPLNPHGNLAPSTPVQATPGQLKQRQMALLAATPPNTSMVLSNSPALKGVIKSDQLPRPLLGGPRSALERVVDYLVGDGPASRYALVCQHCQSHNGMAMAEEFEFFSYYCAYCRRHNAARKQKPPPPPLALAAPSPRTPPHRITANESNARQSSESDSEQDKHSASDSEDEKKEISAPEKPKSPEEKKED